MVAMCYVKVREVGHTDWAFITSTGTTRFRVHALRFTREKAEAMIADNQPDNPGWEWRIIDIKETGRPNGV